jgi:hypothetical protein
MAPAVNGYLWGLGKFFVESNGSLTAGKTEGFALRLEKRWKGHDQAPSLKLPTTEAKRLIG